MEYGCKLSKFDARDYKLDAAAVAAYEFPKEFINEPLQRVKNQGIVSSCVAHALSTILEYHSHPNTAKLSTNFIYGIQKELFGRSDSGMYVSQACKIALNYGDMLERDCPGNTEVPLCHSIASSAKEDEDKISTAYNYHIYAYYSCNSINDIKYSLIHHGPVLAAMKWSNSYRVNKDGILVGDLREDAGYHAVVVYGYNETGFLCQNSWGTIWGDSGRFILPYDIAFREARGIIDCKDHGGDINQPHQGFLWDIFYKIVNGIVNLIWPLIKK